MGNDFVIRGKSITITSLKSHTEAIQKIPTPHTPNDCKSFCGLVYYLSLFYNSLQKVLKPITDLTRKAVCFIWGKLQEVAFHAIKKMISEPSVVHLPRLIGRFILYSDTSREHTGSSLWQIQEGKPHLIGYASKILPSACKNYSVTELEMTGLWVNIGLWKTYLKRCEFHVCVYHAAVVEIMKAKTEPAKPHSMHLLDRLSPYSYNLYYIKGKVMILADYFNRHCISDDHTISISFCPFSVFLHHKGLDTYKITIRSQAKAAREMAPKVHGTDEALNSHVKPDHQSKSTVQTAHATAPKRSSVQSLAKKLTSKSIQHLVKRTSQTSLLDSNNRPSPIPHLLPPVPQKYINQVAHGVPLPYSSPIQGEDSGDLVPLGKYSSRVHHIDDIPDQ